MSKLPIPEYRITVGPGRSYGPDCICPRFPPGSTHGGYIDLACPVHGDQPDTEPHGLPDDVNEDDWRKPR